MTFQSASTGKIQAKGFEYAYLQSRWVTLLLFRSKLSMCEMCSPGYIVQAMQTTNFQPWGDALCRAVPEGGQDPVWSLWELIQSPKVKWGLHFIPQGFWSGLHGIILTRDAYISSVNQSIPIPYLIGCIHDMLTVV